MKTFSWAIREPKPSKAELEEWKDYPAARAHKPTYAWRVKQHKHMLFLSVGSFILGSIITMDALFYMTDAMQNPFLVLGLIHLVGGAAYWRRYLKLKKAEAELCQ